jgi:dTDP-4-amino-4,6-dideoxygalactose transaminase
MAITMESELAINGGSKSVSFDEKELVWPIIPERAKQKVIQLLEKRPAEISLGSTINEFANKFGDYIGVDFSIPLCNGTSGLYSAYACLDLKPGDEIICPSYTYWATAMPAVTFGVKIVFVEIDPITL